MISVVGIRFKKGGKVYYFSPGDLDLREGAWVVAETAKGQECGEVALGVREIDESEAPAPVKPVLRLATDEELARMKANEQRLAEIFKIGQERIDAHKLEMKLIDVDFSLDGKILFFFTSEGRVDFRNLVRDLAAIFHTRIELRQIGVRDEARMLGGLGPCGRGICCREFLSNFQPVSIKMAKEQNLSLNPTKISGLCGRLMCCLKYEQDSYEHVRKRAPRPGREVMTPDGVGIAGDTNILRERVSVRFTAPDGAMETRWYPLDHVGPAGKPLPPEVLSEAAANAQAVRAEKTEAEDPPIKEEPKLRPRPQAQPRAQQADERPAPHKQQGDARNVQSPRRKPPAAGEPKAEARPQAQGGDKKPRSVQPWKPRGESKPIPLPQDDDAAGRYGRDSRNKGRQQGHRRPPRDNPNSGNPPAGPKR